MCSRPGPGRGDGPRGRDKVFITTKARRLSFSYQSLGLRWAVWIVVCRRIQFAFGRVDQVPMTEGR